MEYEFTQDWFTRHIPIWQPLIEVTKPKKILEIGSFEGRCTTFMIEHASKNHDDIEIHCVDTWLGSPEHGDTDFNEVEKRFWKNVMLAKQKVSDRNVDVIAHKGTSLEKLSELVVEGYLSSFDLVLVDGSHMAVDVLYDALLAFKLARVGGIIVFDDYNVMEAPNLEENIDFPKVAIKAWGKIFHGKVGLIQLTVDGADGKKLLTENDTYQLYLTKTSE